MSGGFLSGGFWQGGFLSRGFLSGGLCPGGFVLEPFFCANHLTLHPSILLASYLSTIHLFGGSFLCRQLILHPLASSFRADHLTLYLSTSYFPADHLTVNLSIPLVSCFCAVHPLGKLFWCRPSNSPSVHPFGELFLCFPSLLWVIFVPTM